jgi:oxygen-dependent protoporphyrinogen oxidase
MAHVVIVGAGISGLSTAFYLQERLPGAEINLLEASHRLGGTVWTERLQGFQVEVGANGFLDTKSSTLDLCRRLGLGQHLIPASASARRRYLFIDGQLRALPDSLGSFLRTRLLTCRAKLALLTERFRSSRRDGDESVHDFVQRRAGRQVAEVFADALVTGIHAGDPQLLSMAAAFPRLAEFERRHGSVMAGMAAAARERRAQAAAHGKRVPRGSQLHSFRQGLRLLIESLQQRLRTPPQVHVAVRRVLRETSVPRRPVWTVCGAGREHWRADAVILACPAYRQAEVLADLDANLAEMIAAIPYSPAAVVALGYRRENVTPIIDGFGYIAPQRTRRDVLGVQFCSSIFPERAPADQVLLRAIAGGWNRKEVVTWDDARLLSAVRNELKLVLQIEAPPIFHHIIRWERAIPQYHLGHLDRVARIEAQVASYPGLFLTGNAYHGVAMNDCTEQGDQVAARVAAYVQAQGP